MHQQKIKVVYLPPEGQVVEEEQEVTQTSTLTMDESVSYPQYRIYRYPPLTLFSRGMTPFVVPHQTASRRMKTPLQNHPSSLQPLLPHNHEHKLASLFRTTLQSVTSSLSLHARPTTNRRSTEPQKPLHVATAIVNLHGSVSQLPSTSVFILLNQLLNATPPLHLSMPHPLSSTLVSPS